MIHGTVTSDKLAIHPVVLHVLRRPTQQCYSAVDEFKVLESTRLTQGNIATVSGKQSYICGDQGYGGTRIGVRRRYQYVRSLAGMIRVYARMRSIMAMIVIRGTESTRDACLRFAWLSGSRQSREELM